MSVKPQMAYPGFASATITFAPSRHPDGERETAEARVLAADAMTAGGVLARHISPLSERIISISYSLLTEQERDSFASPDGAGFFHAAGGDEFEYMDTGGATRKVMFAGAPVQIAPDGFGRWRVGPIVMVITG